MGEPDGGGKECPVNTREEKYAFVGTCPSTGVDVTLCYNTFGSSHDPCVFLIMGLDCSALAWDVVICTGIADHGFFVIRFDNRDCGLSTIFKGYTAPNFFRFLIPEAYSYGEKIPYTLHDMMCDAANLLRHLGVVSAHVVGCSMGGMIAQLLALHFPELVQSLVLLSTHSGSGEMIRPPAATYLKFLDRPKSTSQEDMVDYKVRFFADQCGTYPFDESEFRRVIASFYARSPYEGGMPRQLAALLRAPDRGQRLKTMMVPTLLLHGGKDTLIPVENSEQMAMMIPNAKLVVFPCMGHMFPPSLYGDIVDEIVSHAQRYGRCGGSP